MKHVKASEARRIWFRLLDEVAAGEVVVINRKGKRILLREDSGPPLGTSSETPDYSSVIRVTQGDQADEWGWEWSEEGLARVEKQPGEKN